MAAVLSVFGLQLLPDPALAVGSWLRLVNIGGLAAIVYWPRDAEQSGPFASMRRLLRSAGVLDSSWENELLPTALAASAHVLADLPLVFEIKYEDSRTLWHALTQLGPLRGLAMARGQELVDELGEQFVAELPNGPLSHTPEARLPLAFCLPAPPIRKALQAARAELRKEPSSRSHADSNLVLIHSRDMSLRPSTSPLASRLMTPSCQAEVRAAAEAHDPQSGG